MSTWEEVKGSEKPAPAPFQGSRWRRGKTGSQGDQRSDFIYPKYRIDLQGRRRYNIQEWYGISWARQVHGLLWRHTLQPSGSGRIPEFVWGPLPSSCQGSGEFCQWDTARQTALREMSRLLMFCAVCEF